jgi:hypothetical protein
MKVCVKHNEEFQKRCRKCNLEYQKKWYSENKQTQIDRSKGTKQKQQKHLRDILCEYLRKNPCVDCGETDPIVLDFDHADPSTKTFTISQIYGRGLSASALIEEISKCEVRCSNCHRRRTAKQFNQWRHREFN